MLVVMTVIWRLAGLALDICIFQRQAKDDDQNIEHTRVGSGHARLNTSKGPNGLQAMAEQW